MRLLAPLAFVMTSGCGLDVAGLAGQDGDAASTEGGTSIVMPSDGSVPPIRPPIDAGRGIADSSASHDSYSPDAATPPADGGAGCPGVPTGWSPVIYDLSTNSCPGRFSPHEVFGPPSVGASACSCTCSVTQPGSCTQGDLTVTYGNGGNGSCPMLSFMATFNGPGCVMLGNQLSVSGSPNNMGTPLPPQGGTCADMVREDSTQVSAPGARYCDVPADSLSAVCGGTVPSGFAACVVTNGETTCPAGTPFVQRHIVEDHPTLQCSACSSPCTVTTTCANAVVTAFTDMACMMRLGSAVLDGTCSPVMFYTMLPATAVAVEYAATASSTCTAGSSSPTTQLSNPRTICCR